MSESRYFEKSGGDATRHWTISREGIRCRMTWGQVGGARTQASSMTLDDEAHAERYFKKKISEKKRQGYVEVERLESGPADADDGMADATLLDVMRKAREKKFGGWEAYWAGYEPIEGHEGTFAKLYDLSGPGPFYTYLVLSEDGRRGLSFVVKQPGHDPENVSAFLDFVRPRLELAFGGKSHHKVPLPARIGQFDHVLFCAPSLRSDQYGGRLGGVLPILDCEIGDEDTETLVEARLGSRNGMPSTTWDREPHPVIDLRFDLRSETGFEELGGNPSVREKKFKVYPRQMLERALRLLPRAVPDSWLEIQNYRHEVLRLTPTDVTRETPAEVDRFLLGDLT